MRFVRNSSRRINGGRLCEKPDGAGRSLFRLGGRKFDEPAAGLLIGRITRNLTWKAGYAVVSNCHVSGIVASEADMVGGMIGSAAYTKNF